MASRAFSIRPGLVDGSSGAQTPVVLIKDAKVPTRVLVRNVSFGQVVSISYDASALQQFPAGNDSFELPPGAADVFVCDFGESLFAAAAGEAKISVAYSAALPIDLKP